MLDLYLNREKLANGLTREEYKIKTRQLSEKLEQFEGRAADLQKQIKNDAFASREISEAKRLLRIVRFAGPRATFEEKRSLLRLLDIHILYDGEELQLLGGIPTRMITFEELARIIPPHEISSPLLQSELSSDFQPAAEGNSILSDHKHSKDCTPN